MSSVDPRGPAAAGYRSLQVQLTHNAQKRKIDPDPGPCEQAPESFSHGSWLLGEVGMKGRKRRSAHVRLDAIDATKAVNPSTQKLRLKRTAEAGTLSALRFCGAVPHTARPSRGR